MNNQARVLIVEDDTVCRKLQKKILERSKYSVKEASSGRAALMTLQNETIDLLVLDLSMPGIGGVELLTKVRANPLTKKIPVIICSSSSEPDIINKVVSLDISGFVLKPIEAKSFLRKIVQAEKKILPVFEDPSRTMYKLGLEYKDFKELIQTMIDDSKLKLKKLGSKVEIGKFEEFDQFCRDMSASANNLGALALKAAAEEARVMIRKSDVGVRGKYLFYLRRQLEELSQAIVLIQ